MEANQATTTESLARVAEEAVSPEVSLTFHRSSGRVSAVIDGSDAGSVQETREAIHTLIEAVKDDSVTGDRWKPMSRGGYVPAPDDEARVVFASK